MAGAKTAGAPRKGGVRAVSIKVANKQRSAKGAARSSSASASAFSSGSSGSRQRRPPLPRTAAAPPLKRRRVDVASQAEALNEGSAQRAHVDAIAAALAEEEERAEADGDGDGSSDGGGVAVVSSAPRTIASYEAVPRRFPSPSSAAVTRLPIRAGSGEWTDAARLEQRRRDAQRLTSKRERTSDQQRQRQEQEEGKEEEGEEEEDEEEKTEEEAAPLSAAAESANGVPREDGGVRAGVAVAASSPSPLQLEQQMATRVRRARSLSLPVSPAVRPADALSALCAGPSLCLCVSRAQRARLRVEMAEIAQAALQQPETKVGTAASSTSKGGRSLRGDADRSLLSAARAASLRQLPLLERLHALCSDEDALTRPLAMVTRPHIASASAVSLRHPVRSPLCVPSRLCS